DIRAPGPPQTLLVDHVLDQSWITPRMMVFFVGRETSLGTLCQGIPTPVLYKHAVGMDVKQKITRSSHQSRLPVACAPGWSKRSMHERRARRSKLPGRSHPLQ